MHSPDHAPRARWRAAVAAGVLCVALAAATCHAEASLGRDTAEARPKRAVSFTPDTYDHCRAFFITEFSTAAVPMTTQDAMDNYIFTDSFGLMGNISERVAVGASLDMHLARGTIKVAPTLRCKRWLGREQSVDVSLGLAADGSPGIVGPIVNLRYSPIRVFYVQVGACQYREEWYTYAPPEYAFRQHEKTAWHGYGGAGFGGLMGAGFWSAELLAIIGLALTFGGMD